MPQYNLKGEIVPDGDPDAHWWHFDSNTWLLLTGGFLLIAGGLVDPGIIGSLFRMLDIRLWPLSYHLILGVIVLFSIKWCRIYFRWEDYDGADADAAMRFVRLSVAVTAVLALWVLLHATRLFRYFHEPLTRWLGYGESSWMAALAFVTPAGYHRHVRLFLQGMDRYFLETIMPSGIVE